MKPIRGPYVVESVFDENCAVDICLSREAEIPGEGSPQLIASCYGGEDGSGGHDTVAQAEANARLFAASWDLLEACRECLAIADEAYEATGYFKVAKTSEQRMRIEAAIAKATS